MYTIDLGVQEAVTTIGTITQWVVHNIIIHQRMKCTENRQVTPSRCIRLKLIEALMVQVLLPSIVHGQTRLNLCNLRCG
jgi:hypothetical protein